MKKATATDVKNFFGFNTTKEFKDEWTVLTDEEKEYFKTAVGEEIYG